MAEYLLDTNHASRLMAYDPPLVFRVQQSRTLANRFGISITVLAELYYAVYASQNHVQNAGRLRQLVDSMLLWPFDRPVADEFGKIQAEQKAKGRPIPPMDAQIAAVARVYGLTILTADRHFGSVDYLSTENWLDAPA